MTSNYKPKRSMVVTEESFNNAVKAEVCKLYDNINADISAQILAVVLVNLEVNYGWKHDRLCKFVNNLHATAELACNTDVFGKTINTEQLIEHIKDKYGIDLRQEVSTM